MPQSLYDDGTYAVTAALVSTPRRFYPIANTTASIRRDPLWAGAGIALLGTSTLAVYGDLLFLHEQVGVAAVSIMAIIAGSSVSVLRIDALGHRGAMIIGRRSRMRALYLAIRDARTIDRALPEIE